MSAPSNLIDKFQSQLVGKTISLDGSDETSKVGSLLSVG